MFKHLLVPTDGSNLSKDTVARAISFAKETGARITLFYAEPEAPPSYDGMGGISSPQFTQEVNECLDEAANEILDQAQTMAHDAGVESDRLVLVGNRPYELIIQAAEANGCDLIFMASHGRRGVKALLLGSETNKVLTHSRIPVLVYR
jgi:nucleotide-binding universal stress UspA family protein